jgi:TPR repeat protein
MHSTVSKHDTIAEAIKSDVAAAFDLACSYYDGNGVDERNYRQAYRIWRWILQRPDLLDEQMLAECQNRIGRLYYSGVDFPVDHQRALFWFRKAAKNNSASANFFCGLMYANGLGVRQNMKTSVTYFRRAAELGYEGNVGSIDNNSETAAAVELEKIDGIMNEPQSDADLVTAIMQEADLGDTEAQYSLGNCYASGEGVNRNTTAAIYWFRKAAEQGHARAQFRLAEAYRLGVGVECDIEKSKFWRLNAASNGFCESA